MLSLTCYNTISKHTVMEKCSNHANVIINVILRDKSVLCYLKHILPLPGGEGGAYFRHS